MTNFKIVSFIFTHTTFSCDKEMQHLSLCANKEMKVLGQEISRDEVRQATNPNKNLKIKRLHSSLFFLSWRNCGKGYFANYTTNNLVEVTIWGTDANSSNSTPPPRFMLQKTCGWSNNKQRSRGTMNECSPSSPQFKDTTQDEKCLLSLNKQGQNSGSRLYSREVKY